MTWPIMPTYATAVTLVVGSIVADVTQTQTNLDWSNPATWIQVAGPVAVIPLLLLTRRVVTRQELDRALSERDDYKEERDHAVAVLQDQLLPTVIKFTDTVRELMPLLRQRLERQLAADDDYDPEPTAPPPSTRAPRSGRRPTGRG